MSCMMLKGEAKTQNKFTNTHINYSSDLGTIWQITRAYWQAERKQATPKTEIPVLPLSREVLLADSQDSVFRLGHSSILMRLDGKFILTDPVFSERASPVQWMGPKRFHPSPISIEELPELTAVVISHDHYDHLDKATVKKLAAKTRYFVMPLKVGQHMRDWGIEESKIIELDWWQQTQVEDIDLIATPTQHFSGRGLTDRDKTLWASWVIQSQQANLYFSGDSGYFPGFKQIGEKYGPFDVTLVETGAYNQLWSEIHMQPQESLQAHLDLQGKYMLPIHNGTFDLALHDWYEPFEKIEQLAQQHQVNLLTPKFGEQLNLASLQPSHSPWWLQVASAK